MNQPLRSGLTLALCVTISLSSLGLVYQLSRDRLTRSQQQWLLEGLSAVLPAGPYDTDPLSSRREIEAPTLGGQASVTIYTVHRDGQPLAAVLGIVAPDGYNGDISMLLGVDAEARVIGVRVREHRETPGLGDDIEIRRSPWITQFDGLALDELALSDWNVRKYGGHFDGLTGATITPQAIIRTIHRALNWYASHREEIFAA